jgi:phospholipase/carboxylesterase
MRRPSAVPLRLRLLLSIGVVLLAGPGCSREPAAAGRPRPVGDAVAGPIAPPPPAGAPGSTTRGEIAGVRYLEHMTGGARPDERVPMIVALHPMGGDPADFLPLLRRYRRRARLILPYGHPSGGMYIWYDSVRDDVAAPVVTREADRIAAALAALVAARPTVGKPLVTGFSQGGIMTFALAVTHPEALAAAFPISGLLPPSLYPSAALSSSRARRRSRRSRPSTAPPTWRCRPAARAPRSPSCGAPGTPQSCASTSGSSTTPPTRKLGEILERIGRAADGLADAAPAP